MAKGSLSFCLHCVLCGQWERLWYAPAVLAVSWGISSIFGTQQEKGRGANASAAAAAGLSGLSLTSQYPGDLLSAEPPVSILLKEVRQAGGRIVRVFFPPFLCSSKDKPGLEEQVMLESWGSGDICNRLTPSCFLFSQCLPVLCAVPMAPALAAAAPASAEGERAEEQRGDCGDRRYAAAGQIVLRHRAQEHSGCGTQGHHALPGTKPVPGLWC